LGHPLTHQDIVKLLSSPEMEEFFSAELIAFFRDNGDLFQQYLGRKTP